MVMAAAAREKHYSPEKHVFKGSRVMKKRSNVGGTARVENRKKEKAKMHMYAE